MFSLLTGKADKLFSVSPGPHLKASHSTKKILWGSFGALAPILIASFIFFGWNALRIFFVATSSAIGFECLFQVVLGRKIQIKNGSTVLFSTLLVFLMPPTIPSWVVVVGSFITVVIGKEIFGGLGQNLFHPTIAGYAALLALFPSEMVSHIPPSSPIFGHLFWTSGSDILGGSSILAIILSGTILIIKKWAPWQSPFLYLVTVLLGSMILGRDLMDGIWSGGVLICAFFFVTDGVTIPITKTGRMIFAVGAGVLTVITYLSTDSYRAMASSILLMNAVTPLIDRLIRPRSRGLR